MATTSARGPYAKTREVRRRILEKASEVFAETGFRATTVKEIASRAGISERGLVHHFESKEHLLTGVLAIKEQETAKLIEARNGVEALRALLGVVKDNVTHPGLLELHSTLTAEAVSPEHPAHVHYLARYDSFRAYLSDLFATLHEDGLLISDVDPTVLASMYIALNDGLQVQWLYDRDSVDLEQVLGGFLLSICPAIAVHEPATP
jgi:Transcriptional regulator